MERDRRKSACDKRTPFGPKAHGKARWRKMGLLRGASQNCFASLHGHGRLSPKESKERQQEKGASLVCLHENITDGAEE